jgi:Domain of unknown function (DUF4411)
MLYLLDTNVFIQAKNMHYGLDFCPAFWDWLVQQNGSGRVHSIEKVGDELLAGTDELSDWTAKRGDEFFLPPDEGLLKALPTVSTWVHGQSYRPAVVSAFLQDADYYLISHALAHKCTVVTHEKAENAVRRVPIPNVCIGVKVKCMTPFEMLRRERARFVLGKHP